MDVKLRKSPFVSSIDSSRTRSLVKAYRSMNIDSIFKEQGVTLKDSFRSKKTRKRENLHSKNN